MHVSAGGWRQLVLTETHHPQWRCTIDGSEVPVYLTDYAFMSVRVPPGEHEVAWWFEPIRFKQGMVVSLIAASLTFGLLGFSWFRSIRKRGTERRSDRVGFTPAPRKLLSADSHMPPTQ